jgi:hypothetical protein
MGIIMDTSNLQVWVLEYKGHEVKVTNTWRWNMVSSADIYINGEHLDKNTNAIVNPKKPTLKYEGYSKDIKSIKVFFVGVFSIKTTILINNEIIHQDKLSIYDRMYLKLF